VPSVDFIELFAWHEGCLGLFVESDSVTLWTEKKSPQVFPRDSDENGKGRQEAGSERNKKNSLKFLERMPIRKVNKADGKPKTAREREATLGLNHRLP
jgi:hypothetical protein